MEEEWKTIKDYENYQVSNMGNFYNAKLDRYISGGKKQNGYIELQLKNNGVKKYLKAHRLVALAFIDNPENKPFIDHIDGDKQNNKVENLRFCTNSENQQNQKVSNKNRLGVKGVWLTPNRTFHAHIRIDGIKVNLGTFKTLDEARQARIKKVNEVFGEFTHSSEKL